MNRYLIHFGLTIFLSSVCSLAQEQKPVTNPEDSSVESLYEKNETAGAAAPVAQPIDDKLKKEDIHKVSELSRLAPFDDIAVIERRFLPKTGRFEVTLGGAATLNDAFFNNVGAVVHFGYYIREKYGVELSYFRMSSSETQTTKDLREKRSVITTSLVTTKSFLGLDFKWSPIYGKMTLLNSNIVPFDIYF